jgi:diguanylate cyclase (GGDEF)-like protein
MSDQLAAARMTPPPIIVIGVEQEWAARSLESVLTPEGFTVVRAYSGRQTLDLAEVASPDVVLIDSRLSDVDGIDVCRALRDERGIGAHVPLVITTSGPASRDFVRSAYAAGAWSVWEQPIDGELLVLRLRTWVDAKRVTDVAERARLIDDTNNLYTARGLARRAREVLADAARRQTPVAAIAIGPAPMRATGGTSDAGLSHAVLRALGTVTASVARSSDVVGRLGPGEVAIVAPMTGTDGAVELVERLRDRLVRLPAPLADAGLTRLAVHAGIATAGEELLQLRDGSVLLQRASTALRFAMSSQTESIRVYDNVPATFV